MEQTITGKNETKRAVGNGIRYTLTMKNNNPDDSHLTSSMFVDKDTFDHFKVGDKLTPEFYLSQREILGQIAAHSAMPDLQTANA